MSLGVAGSLCLVNVVLFIPVRRGKEGVLVGWEVEMLMRDSNEKCSFNRRRVPFFS